MTRQRRVGLALAAAAALCLPLNRLLEAPLLPLARGYAAAAASLLAGLGVAVEREDTVLRHSPRFAVEVTAGCTAWFYFALWIVGLIALRPHPRRVLVAGGAGVAVLAVANLVRLAMITAVGARFPAAFEWIHHLAGEALMGATWLLLWSAVTARGARAASGRELGGTPPGSYVPPRAFRVGRALCPPSS